MHSPYHLPLALLLVAAMPVVALAEHGLSTLSSAELWEQFRQSPYTHPNIPNVSFAGYRYSQQQRPTPPVVANVRDFGAVGDGSTDDTQAFHNAIARAAEVGGGTVLVPEGQYRITQILEIRADGVVLRGEGSSRSVLLCDEPVERLRPGVRGSWDGGLIWIEPAPTRQPRPAPVAITAPARMGDFTVQVSPEGAQVLAAHVGQMLEMVWSGDLSLCMHIAGHESMRAYDWRSWNAFRTGRLTWTWLNEIASVEGTTVHLVKPLRLDVQEGWTVEFRPGWRHIREVGIEGIAIRYPHTQKAAHLREPGYNGILMRRAAHCWVSDFAIHNADNGIIFRSQCVNNTVSRFRITGRPNHHATMLSGMSHDNLFQNFRIESRPHHGINTEGTSSGNVWRAGQMLHGTFDSHCMLSFDSVRTNITVANSGGPGGAADHGPFQGRRMTHWNIRITNGRPDWIAAPAYHPSGALVGIQGAQLLLQDTRLWHMPDGLDKGCVISDHGQAPVPADLFEAQLRLRLGREH